MTWTLSSSDERAGSAAVRGLASPAGMLQVYNELDARRQMKVLQIVEEQRVAQRRVERRAAKRALQPRTAAASHLS